MKYIFRIKVHLTTGVMRSANEIMQEFGFKEGLSWLAQFGDVTIKTDKPLADEELEQIRSIIEKELKKHETEDIGLKVLSPVKSPD